MSGPTTRVQLPANQKVHIADVCVTLVGEVQCDVALMDLPKFNMRLTGSPARVAAAAVAAGSAPDSVNTEVVKALNDMGEVMGKFMGRLETIANRVDAIGDRVSLIEQRPVLPLNPPPRLVGDESEEPSAETVPPARTEPASTQPGSNKATATKGKNQ